MRRARAAASQRGRRIALLPIVARRARAHKIEFVLRCYFGMRAREPSTTTTTSANYIAFLCGGCCFVARAIADVCMRARRDRVKCARYTSPRGAVAAPTRRGRTAATAFQLVGHTRDIVLSSGALCARRHGAGTFLRRVACKRDQSKKSVFFFLSFVHAHAHNLDVCAQRASSMIARAYPFVFRGHYSWPRQLSLPARSLRNSSGQHEECKCGPHNTRALPIR